MANPLFSSALSPAAAVDPRAQILRMGGLRRRDDLLRDQLALAQGLHRPISGDHSTGGGAALGGLGDLLRGVAGDLRERQIGQQRSALTDEAGQGRKAYESALAAALAGKTPEDVERGMMDVGALGMTSGDESLGELGKELMSTAAAQQGSRLKQLLDAKRQKDEQAEWDRRNAVTSKQEMARAHVMAGQREDAAEAAEERAVKREERKDTSKQEGEARAIEERAQNILTELDKLEGLVGQYGTFELGGSASPEMDAAITSIAIDMAKLRDPTSVAREAEVEMEKKALFTPGAKGLLTSNATAKELIKKYRERVNSRRGEAYKVRGLNLPGEVAPAPKTIEEQPTDLVSPDGKRYRLNPQTGKYAEVTDG